MDPTENPYAAPEAQIHRGGTRSSLSKLWRKALTNSLRHHSEGASLGLLLRLWWKNLLYGVIYFLAAGGLMFAAGLASAGWFWLGVGAGFVLFTLSQFRVQLQLWPMWDRIIDWDRVRRLLDEGGDPGRPDA